MTIVRPLTSIHMNSMTPKELGLAFIARFCAGDVEGLEEILCEQLRFSGPFLQATSRAAYLASLAQGPPEPAEYRILSVTESGSEASIFYEYIKPEGRGIIAQWWRAEGGCIAETRLVFDPREFV